MHSNVERLRRRAQHPVGDCNVRIDQVAPVVATGRQRRLHVGIPEFCERCLVDLNISAPRPRQGSQLFVESLDRVVPELTNVTIGECEHRGIATPEMQRARTRNRDLGKQFRPAFEKIEISNIDRVSPAHAAFDKGDRLRSASAVIRRASCIHTGDGIDAQVAELLIEKAMVRPATEFAVSRETQTYALLQGKRI